MIRHVLFAILSVCIIGCASQPASTSVQTVDPNTLREVPGQSQHELLTPISWTKKAANAFQVDTEQGLLQGSYSATRAGDSGTYYQGPARAIYFRNLPSGPVTVSTGGFWLPADPNAKPRLFLVIGAATWRAPTLPEVLAGSAAPLTQQQTSAANAINPTSGAAGLGAAIVDVFADADRGKYMLLGEVSDDSFSAKLRALSKAKP
jgi:hypothetical protein